MTRSNPIRELTWLMPFICIGLITTALLRPLQKLTAIEKKHIVIDAEGIQVPIAMPFRGAVLTWGAWGPEEYLETTNAPETLLDYGTPAERNSFGKNAIMSWIYPKILNRDELWNMNATARGRGANAEIETLLSSNAGAYLGNSGSFGVVPLLRRLGLPALTLSWNAKNWDEVCFSTARVETTLVGEPERGEFLIAHYKQAFTDLVRELEPQKLESRPRVLIMGSSTRDWAHLYVKSVENDYQLYLPPAGVENASKGFTGERQDAERILSMDPDIIFAMGYGQSPNQFKRDPRWRGMKAVRENRVYTMPGMDPGGGGLGGIIFQPLWTRWMAEIAHPDRLQPKLRALMRERLLTEFDYSLSGEQIDLLLRLSANKDSVGYERFTENYQASNGQEQ